MHSLSCCASCHSGALAVYWITGTVNFSEETGWNNIPDLNCLHIRPKVLLAGNLTVVNIASLWFGCFNVNYYALYVSINLCNS